MVVLEERNKITSLLPIIFFILLATAAFAYTLPTMRNTLTPWYGAVVTREEVDAALWADANLPRKSFFAADLFACEMLVSAGGMVCSIGGAWELADRANQRFYDNERAFLSKDAREARDLFAQYGVQYVFVHPRTGFYAYGWKQPEMKKFEDARYFTPVYDLNNAKIYSVNYFEAARA